MHAQQQCQKVALGTWPPDDLIEVVLIGTSCQSKMQSRLTTRKEHVTCGVRLSQKLNNQLTDYHRAHSIEEGGLLVKQWAGLSCTLYIGVYCSGDTVPRQYT